MSAPRKAEREWAALQEALAVTRPACAGDDRFVADDPPAVLAGICRRCPARAPCGAYARRAKPGAGYWAGRDWAKPYREEGEAA
ncbi:hypothetical protein GCM10011490_06770 [Pseudoclavibacter endophyticus]|nr:hypothetical protein GCM10011490_06770 [Pseudoclavibacter endophyticus]